MSATGRFDSPPSFKRSGAIAAVVLLHVVFLWALQTGLLRKTIEIIVPAEVISDLIDRPEPKVEPPQPAKPPEPIKRLIKTPTPIVQPQPLAITDTSPAPNAVSGVTEPPPPVVAVAAPPAPPRVELPSSNADYLQNPKPAYPAASRRLNEQGKVLIRVFIAIDGSAQKTELSRSSGYERLDQAALETVQRWRFVPGKRNGVPEAMWFIVPINFVLD